MASQENIRAYRSKIALLKKKGLIRKSIDARSHKPTRYMLGQIKRFEHILDGTAIAVKVPKHKIAKEFDTIKDTKFNRVIVRVQKGEKGRYTKDGIKINRKSKFEGFEDTNEFLSPRSLSDIPKLPKKKGSKFVYAIPFKRGGEIERIFFSDEELLLKFISGYEGTPARFKGIRGYIQILETKTNEKAPKRKRAPKKKQTKTRKK